MPKLSNLNFTDDGTETRKNATGYPVAGYIPNRSGSPPGLYNSPVLDIHGIDIAAK